MIEQNAPGASDAPQPFDWTNSTAVVAMLLMVSVAVPVLLRVRDALALLPTGTFPNATGVGVRDTPGAVPVPARETRCGLPGASDERLSCPECVPAAVGE